MTVKIKRNTITMTRGDSLRLKIDLYEANGDVYIASEDDRISVGLNVYYDDLRPLIVREIPTDTCILQLYPQDTKHLYQPRDYVYDIQIEMSDGTVDTFISRGKFRLTEEVD